MELFFIGAQLVLNLILIILVVVAYKTSAKTSKKLSELNAIYIKNYKIFTEIVKLSFTRFKAETNNSLLLFNWDLDRKDEKIKANKELILDSILRINELERYCLVEKKRPEDQMIIRFCEDQESVMKRLIEQLDIHNAANSKKKTARP